MEIKSIIKITVQTSYDIVKAHGGSITVNSFNSPPGGSISVISNYHEPGELKVDSNGGEGSLALPAVASAQAGSKFTLQIPVA